jgi:hypothetical protein
MNKEYKDYPAEKIADKLNQVKKYENKYGKSLRTVAIRKWCTDINYRRKEWEWRQNVAKSINYNTNYYD